MKNFLVCFFIAALISACSGSGVNGISDNGPMAVTKKFMKHIEDGDIEGAKKYCTEGSYNYLGILAAGAAVNPMFKSEIRRDSIVGDQAWVICYLKDRNKEVLVKLFKVNNAWKVNFQM